MMPSSTRSCKSCGSSLHVHHDLEGQPLSPLHAIPSPARFPHVASGFDVPPIPSRSPQYVYRYAIPNTVPAGTPPPQPQCEIPEAYYATIPTAAPRSVSSRASDYSMLASAGREPSEAHLPVYQPTLGSPAVTDIGVEPQPATPPLSPCSNSSNTSVSSAKIPQSLTRHHQFYLTNDLVTLKVNNSLFRVHRCFLERDSVYLRDVLAALPGRGKDDEDAIVVPGITLATMESFLNFQYFGAHGPQAYSPDSWKALLAVSRTLRCTTLRERAIYELSSPAFEGCFSTVDRIILAREHSIDSWLAPAYFELCTRKRPLQEKEIECLGGKLTSRVAEVRERLLADATEYSSLGEPAGRRESTSSLRVQLLIDEVFGRTRM